MVSQRNRILIGVVVLVVIVGLFAGVGYIQTRNASSAQGDIPPGSIPMYMDGNLVASFSPNDLDYLGMMSFVEEEQGKTEEGWLLRDVVLLHLKTDQLQPGTHIIVSSSSRKKSAQLTWEEVQDPENMVLFDLAGSGTLKLVSVLSKLDTRDEWVQDVDKIEVETP